jgi:hypothetical protein
MLGGYAEGEDAVKPKLLVIRPDILALVPVAISREWRQDKENALFGGSFVAVLDQRNRDQAAQQSDGRSATDQQVGMFNRHY